MGRIIDVELVPSAPGDPVLADGTPAPSGYGTAVLAASTAERLGVDVGGKVEGIVARTRHDRQESVRLPLAVIGVAPAGAFARDGVFVSSELIAAVEDFLDGRAVPALGWDGSAPRSNERAFAGFRLYARNLDDVAPLRRELREQGIDVRTSVADISLVKTLDRNLSAVYWIIAAIAIAGFGLSFATSVWANIDRKQREFSVLRLSGFRTKEIVWFPILQAVLTAVGAWLLSVVAFVVIQALLNGLLADEYRRRPACLPAARVAPGRRTRDYRAGGGHCRRFRRPARGAAGAFDRLARRVIHSATLRPIRRDRHRGEYFERRWGHWDFPICVQSGCNVVGATVPSCSPGP